MRILWAKVGGLWPMNTGGRLRSFHIISELSRRHDVTLVTTHGPDDDPHGLAAALPRCEVVSLPWVLPKRGSARFCLAVLRSQFSRVPVDLYKSRVPELRQEVERRIGAGTDLCVADFLAGAGNVPLDRRVPVVLFEHNVEYVIWQRLSGVEPRVWRRVLL